MGNVRVLARKLCQAVKAPLKSNPIFCAGKLRNWLQINDFLNHRRKNTARSQMLE